MQHRDHRTIAMSFEHRKRESGPKQVVSLDKLMSEKKRDGCVLNSASEYNNGILR